MPSTVHLLTASTIRARKLSIALKTPVATSEPRARMLRSFQVPDADGSSRGVTHSVSDMGLGPNGTINGFKKKK